MDKDINMTGGLMIPGINSKLHAAMRGPSGVTFDEKYHIGNFLRDDNYAKVYEVTCNSTSLKLEARFYTCNVTSDRAQRYQLRNKRRLMSRSVFNGKWKGQTVIIYITGDTNVIVDDPTKSHTLSVGSTKSETVEKRAESSSALDMNIGHKSNNRRDAERRRQCQKRQLIRQKHRTIKRIVKPEACFGQAPEFNVFLHLSYFSSVAIREEQADTAERIIDNCLRPRILEFPDAGDMDKYINAKQHDIALLQALRDKLPSITQQKNDELVRATKKQQNFIERPLEIAKSTQTGAIASAKCNLQVVTIIESILPRIIEKAQVAYDTLSERLPRVQELQRQIEEEKKSLDTLRGRNLDTAVAAEPDRRGRHIGSLRSALCVQTHYHSGYNRSVAAEEELSKYQAQAENAPLPKIVSLKEEYQTLLKFTDAVWSTPP